MTDAPGTAESGGFRNRIGEELGAEFIERGPGRAVIRFPIQDRYRIPSGVLQGGMYAALMDMAMASAAEGQLSTASLQINLLRPAMQGYLVVTGEVVRRGRTMMYLEAEVRSEDGTLIARGNQTGTVMPRRPQPGGDAEGAGAA